VKEIRITFDRAISEGMSVVGGGESFPELPGKPRRANLQPGSGHYASSGPRFPTHKFPIFGYLTV
jgi:hypothetical protein